MDINIKIAELEEKARQLTIDIANQDEKREELNRVKMLLNLVRPKISEDAPVANANEEPEEQQVVDESVPGIQLNPFEVFPELVWQEISHKVKDMQDWLNLYSASSKLKDLMENGKLERIFPQIFPRIFKYLERKDVINLCGASRNIASAIISWVQARCLAPRWAGMEEDDDYENEIPLYSLMVTLDSRDKMQLITNELLEGGSGFLIPFGITFDDWHLEGVDYWERAKTFLQLFGTRIWFCRIIFTTDGNPDPRHFPEMVIQCLRLIPNVMRLGLEFTYDDEELPNPIPLAHPPIFPHLTKLRVLSLVQISHENFMDFLKLHADQLKSLSIEGEHAPEESFRYSKLNKLHLTGDRIVPLKLDSFALAPVSKLYSEINAEDFAEFGEMFLQFNNFGGTLETLELRVYIESHNNYSKELPPEETDMTWVVNIHLPQLKKLSMWNYGGGLGLLIGMPSLQELKLDAFPFANDGSIQLEWGSKGILNSNIWYVLSNLQSLELQKVGLGRRNLTCTREEYNQYHDI